MIGVYAWATSNLKSVENIGRLRLFDAQNEIKKNNNNQNTKVRANPVVDGLHQT